MMITAAGSASSSGDTASPVSSALPGVDGEQFMQILLAQLRHQNPLEPMKDNEMMSQMTQLNSLMELQKINTSLEALIELYQGPAAGEEASA